MGYIDWLHQLVGLLGGGGQDHYLCLIIVASSLEQTRIPFDKDNARFAKFSWNWVTLEKTF